MKALLCIAFIALLGCAAPKDSNAHFGRPKYDLSPRSPQGKPSVSQRWWSRAWFWQPRYTPNPRSIR